MKSCTIALQLEFISCKGDAVDKLYYDVGANGRYKHVFMRQGFEAEKADSPQRQRVEFRFSMHVGDHIDLTVWPRASQDCDGVYIVDIQVWEHDGLKKPTKTLESKVSANNNSVISPLKSIKHSDSDETLWAHS